MIKIGDFTLKNPFILAPLAGYTNYPMRILAEEQGAALSFSEMVSAKGLYYGDSKTGRLLYIPGGSNTAIQLFGSEPEILAYAARQLDQSPARLIDINMGCPVPKIVNNGEGAALMKDPDLVYKIVRAVTQATSKPVSVKIRKGFDAGSVNADIVAKAAADGGASAVSVHGRLRSQYYAGDTDYEIIRKVKSSVDIPVIGNGDVRTGEDALNMMKNTGCDAVMIGRGAIGNPWIFRECINAYQNQPYSGKRTKPEISDMMLRHLDLLEAAKGSSMACLIFRKFVPFYTKGVTGTSFLRRKVNTINDITQMKEVLKSENW